MSTQLENRIRSLRQRRSDPIKGVQLRSRILEKSEGRFDSAQDALEYITESMLEVDNPYTQLTFEECDRIQNHITEACEKHEVPVSFRHQGSVTTNTHIKFYSDIDLLVLTEKFISLESPLKVTLPYKGDPLADLKEIRNIVVDRLTSSFPKATIDNSGSKAVALSGGSLRRKIDVIAANWLDTEKYQQTQDELERGVRILDLSNSSRISNFPFIHNRELNDKDRASNGSLKKLVRFVKSVRYDADGEINVSSYDIAGLCYHLPLEDFLMADKSDYTLAKAFLQFSNKVLLSQHSQNELKVPNGTRRLFGDSGINAENLKLLNEEIEAVLNQAKTSRSFK